MRHSAGLQASLIKVAAAATKPIHDRGLTHVVRYLGRVFPPSNRIEITRFGKQLFLYLNDGYWIRLIRHDWVYEPEVEATLAQLLSPNTYFLDCGANIGYWSAFASNRLPRSNIIGVEASPIMFERLVENAALNKAGWTCLNAAIWSTGGETLTMHSPTWLHAGGTVVDRLAPEGSVKYAVPTTTIDELIAQYAHDERFSVVIKLDVEGAEVEALRGAANSVQSRRIAIIYEDHGKDKTHIVSRYVRDEMRLQIFALTDAGRYVAINRIDDLDALKINPQKGYNFVAATYAIDHY